MSNVWVMKIIKINPVNLEETPALTWRVRASCDDAWDQGLAMWRVWLRQHEDTPSKLSQTTPPYGEG